MIDRIKNTGATQQTDKSRKTKRSSNVNGPSFEALVNEASQTEQVSEIEPPRAIGTNTEREANTYLPDSVPTEPKARGHYILDRLEELEQDILSGNPTAALAKLQEALAADSIGREDLPPRLQRLLDEVDLRASAEMAKLKVDEKA